MPRTKKVSAAKKKNKNEQEKSVEMRLAFVDATEQKQLLEMQENLKKDIDAINCEFAAFLLSLPRALLDKTIGETNRGEVFIDLSCNSRTILGNSTLSNTQNTLYSTIGTLKKGNGNTCKTTVSKTLSEVDEGYTTAESTRGTTSGTRSSRRSKSQPMSRTRVSRSLSRTLKQSSTRSNSKEEGYDDTGNAVPGSSRQSRSKTKVHSTRVSRTRSRTQTKDKTFTTPISNKPLSNVGSITPKCKPNTPLLFMRRPKVGEMAWSNQGSPLLVYGAAAQDRIANINIPIGDDVLSLMPTRGVLRESEIPHFEGDTRKQLEALRDNLIKVCQSNNN